MYQSRYLLKALPVGFIKCIQIFAVYIQNGHDLAFPEYRNDYFAAGKTAAGDVAGKLFNIGDDNAFLALPRRPAHSPAERNTAACDRTLKRAQHQLITFDNIKTGPPECI